MLEKKEDQVDNNLKPFLLPDLEDQLADSVGYCTVFCFCLCEVKPNSNQHRKDKKRNDEEVEEKFELVLVKLDVRVHNKCW